MSEEVRTEPRRLIDPMVSLAFSVYSNKGAYALLLGSGISRAAGIPTGWEVVLDLIRKVAKTEKDDCEPEPDAWFRKKYSEEPDYSKLLDAIAKTPTERQQLLRGYFEPTEEERSQGMKLPTAAHKAVAQLAAAGYVRVIITTNFDRLTEKALEETGVAPTVISTPDQLKGALPLVHSGISIIKVHGDYLDTRIKNTVPELSKYEPAMDALLDRVTDEYGLIVCGWSAEWDAALRAAIERCPSRRFSTYWTTRTPLSGKAKVLAEHRKAEVITLRNADQFFDDLHNKVRALEDISTSHPLSAKLAAATVKRYLPDQTAKIRLRDMIHELTERLVTELNQSAFSPHTTLEDATEIRTRVAKYEALCETALAIMTAGGYWADHTQLAPWVECFERIANVGPRGAGYDYLWDLKQYPALLLLYGSGIAAIAARNYHNFATLLTLPKVKNDQGQPEPIGVALHHERVINVLKAKLLSGMADKYTPISDHLFSVLRAPLREYIPAVDAYVGAFERFEYLRAMVYADLTRTPELANLPPPVGRFHGRGRRTGEPTMPEQIFSELTSEGVNWPLLKAGLFGADALRALQAARLLRESLAQNARER